jgi:hypothetical protein
LIDRLAFGNLGPAEIFLPGIACGLAAPWFDARWGLATYHDRAIGTTTLGGGASRAR